MQGLLSIETSFLNLQQVKEALNLTEIRSVQRTLTSGQKKKFEQTLSLSKLVVNAVEWFNSEEGKRSCNEEGISWSNEELGLKVFGWQKSFFYKVIKAGKLEADLIETFKTKCDEAETNGAEPNRSLEGLLKFAKQSAQAQTTNEGESGDGEAGEEAQIEIRPENVVTFKCKAGGMDVLVKIDSNGNVTTNSNKEAIEEAINVLRYSVLQHNF